MDVTLCYVEPGAQLRDCHVNWWGLSNILAGGQRERSSGGSGARHLCPTLQGSLTHGTIPAGSHEMAPRAEVPGDEGVSG